MIALGGDLQATFAYFDIERDDALDTFNRDSVGLIGGRTADGVELSASYTPNERFAAGLNLGYTDAAFTPSANAVSLAGNTPANVAKWTLSAHANYQPFKTLPVDIGASVRYVGDRFGDHANTVTLKKYTLVDLFVGWNVNDAVRLSARIDNLLDKTYIPWSDYFYLGQTDPGFLYANQLIVGAPRSYGFSIRAVF